MRPSVLIAGICVAWGLLIALPTRAQLQRVPNTTLAMPPAPPTIGFTSTNTFPGLVFTNPVCLAWPPGETNRLFILSKNGLISVITNLSTPVASASTFMDLTPEVTSQSANSGTAGERGLLGMAFHPGFATNGYFYILYMSTNPVLGNYNDRLSRFKISAANTNQGDTTSEVNIYNQYDRDPNHNAGDIHFGADGYLYVSVGDEGAEHDGRFCAQVITNSLFSGILRLDVDKRPGNIAPNPGTPALTTTTNYLIPADNPFIGITNYNGLAVATNMVRTEFYAIGLRNPWRWNFDFFTNSAGTNVLYCGDVGQDKYEEVDAITKGGNYGWAYWEGTNIASGGTLPHFEPLTSIFPILQYAHGTASNQGNCVIGGVVYRGSNYPELYGDYIYADYVDGNVWSLVASNYTTGSTNINNSAGPGTPLFSDSTLNITAFGTDPRNGDVLFCATKTTGYATAATINRIVYNIVTNGAPVPPTLADTGAFTNLMTLASPLDTLQPAPGIIPYTINVPFWSDNAIKSRWISVPNTNLTIGFNPAGNWSFPTGTVWIKHFNLQLTNGDAASEIRLETRLLVKNPAGVYGVTYRWGGSQTNATLVPASGMDENFVINNGGILTTQTWHYPSQNECVTCHTAAGGFGLGVRTEQLNCPQDYGGGPTNELQALSAAGYFTMPMTNNVQFLAALATATNPSASLELRARSFLAANCSQCHQPGGTVSQANWDARISTPLALAGIVNGALVNNLGDSGNCVILPNSVSHSVLLARIATRGANSIQMPPLDSNLADAQATNLITQWILSMTNTFWVGASPAAQTSSPGASVAYDVTFLPTADYPGNVTLSVSGLPAGASASFNPAIVNGGTTNSILTISNNASVAGGTYILNISGTDGIQTNASAASLAISVGSQTPAGTLLWIGAGTDTNWSTALNWTNLTVGGYGPPGISNDVIFNNAGAGLTNFNDASEIVNSLWYRLLPASGGSLAQYTRINPGQTLTITGTNMISGSSFVTAGYSLLVGTNSSANGNGSAASAIVIGPGGTLNVNRPDGVIAVAEYNTSGNHPTSASTRASLDLSGLDNFTATASQVLIGCMANGSAGALILAKTNILTAEGGSVSGTAGIDLGNNGSNAGDPSYLYMGLNNHIHASVIRAGGAKGYWGLIAFNPAVTNLNPTAVFRGTSGDNSRVSTWIVSDLVSATGTANVTQPRGTNDFTGGDIDALIDSLVIGKTTTAAISGTVSSNRISQGTFTINAGTVNVNYLTNGLQLPNPGGTIPAGDSSDSGIGILNVNGGTLAVNNNLVLGAGVSALQVPSYPNGVLVAAIAEGILNVNGGTVITPNIVAGNSGLAFISLNNATLILTNNAGSATKAISTFTTTNSALHLHLAAGVTNIITTNLAASGVNTIAIDAVPNLGDITTFPVISYSGNAPADGSFVKGLVPAGFAANLVNNTSQKRIDLVVAPIASVTPRMGSAGIFGTNLVIGGSNGFPNGGFYVLAGTNLAAPFNQWWPVSTNPFDANGGFNFTNPLNPNLQQLYYLMQLQ